MLPVLKTFRVTHPDDNGTKIFRHQQQEHVFEGVIEDKEFSLKSPQFANKLHC